MRRKKKKRATKRSRHRTQKFNENLVYGREMAEDKNKTILRDAIIKIGEKNNENNTFCFH
jgi:hypothetical protein